VLRSSSRPPRRTGIRNSVWRGFGPDLPRAAPDLIFGRCHGLCIAARAAPRLLGAPANPTTDLHSFVVHPGWAWTYDDGAPRTPASAIQLWLPFLTDALLKRFVVLNGDISLGSFFVF